MLSVFALLIPLALLIRSKRNKKTDESQNLVAQFPPDNTSVVPPLSKTPKGSKISIIIFISILVLIVLCVLGMTAIFGPGRYENMELGIILAFGLVFLIPIALISLIVFICFAIRDAVKMGITEPEQEQEPEQDQNQSQEQEQEHDQNQGQGQQQQK